MRQKEGKLWSQTAQVQKLNLQLNPVKPGTVSLITLLCQAGSWLFPAPRLAAKVRPSCGCTDDSVPGTWEGGRGPTQGHREGHREGPAEGHAGCQPPLSPREKQREFPVPHFLAGSRRPQTAEISRGSRASTSRRSRPPLGRTALQAKGAGGEADPTTIPPRGREGGTWESGQSGQTRTE